MTPRPFLAAAALLALVGSALLPLPSSPDESDALGMELDTSGPFPQPGPFREDPRDLHRLDRFLRLDGAVLLESCGNPQAVQAVEQAVEDGFFLYALELLYYGCTEAQHDAVEREALQSIRNKTEQEDYERYRLQAIAMLEHEKELLNHSVHIANAVEAQVLAVLMNLHLWHAASIHTTSNLTFQGYLDHGREIDLVNTFYNLLLPMHGMNITPWILDQYPWSQEASCGPHDLAALEARVQTKLDHLLALGAKLDEPGHEQYVTTMHGAALKVIAPYVAFEQEHDWWPGLLAWEARIDWDIAYWENYTTKPLPTAEEALLLIAQYRNHTRTLVTEDRLSAHLEDARSGVVWDERDARHIAALPAMQWTFGPDQLDCRQRD